MSKPCASLSSNPSACPLDPRSWLVASSQERPIGSIAVGDRVRTWIGGGGAGGTHSAAATVVGIIDVERHASDLMEAVFTHKSGSGGGGGGGDGTVGGGGGGGGWTHPTAPLIVSTMDHPYWSVVQNALVSLDPAATMFKYDLTGCGDDLGPGRNVSLARDVEMLEGIGGLPISAELKRHAAADPEALVATRTLMLEASHWFYAGGVRVHNKGCFVAGTVVSMFDGSFKAIQVCYIRSSTSHASLQYNDGCVVPFQKRFERDNCLSFASLHDKSWLSLMY